MATGGEVKEQYSDSLGSEDLDDLKCQPCHEEGEIQDAVGICLDCQDYLCQRCFDGHTLPKPCRHHKLLDKSQMFKSKIQLQRKDKCTQQCPQHDDEIVKYYCTDHGQLGCSVCLNLDHRTCKAVYIPHAAKDLANNEEFNQVERQLTSALDELKTFTETVQHDTESLTKNCAEVLRKVEAFRKDINKALDTIQMDIIDQIEAMKTTLKKELDDISDKYRGLLHGLQSTHKKTERLKSTSQKCDLYVEILRMKEKLKDVDNDLKKAAKKQAEQITEIHFTPNTDLLESLNDPETFGKLIYSETYDVIGANHICDINVKTDADTKTCNITGSTLLHDGRLAVVDEANHVIKVVDSKKNMPVTQLKLSSRPWDICRLEGRQVAVTLPAEKKAVFITVSDTVNVDKTIDVSAVCYGVCYRRDTLAVSFSSPYKVGIMDLQGRVIREITVDQQRRPLFELPFHVIFGRDDSTVYVSNFSRHNVVCIRLDGTVVTSYTDSDLSLPWGSVADNNGNIYICGRGSDNIHKISPDCQKVQILLGSEKGLTKPSSISYSDTERQFYVGMEGSNVIKVYKAVLGPL